MEALASGLFCIASDIRGNEDLVSHGRNGELVEISDITKWKKCIERYGCKMMDRYVKVTFISLV